MTRLKLFGAFRSGTNYLKALLELHCDVRVVGSHGGWKHAPVPALFGREHGWPIVGVVRDPWVWLDSLHRHVTHGQQNDHVVAETAWPQFLLTPITITHAGKSDVPTYRFATPVDYWNAMAVNLLSVADRGVVMTYEDVLLKPANALDAMVQQLGIRRTRDDLVDLSLRTRNMVDRPREGRREYLTEEPFDRARALRPRRLYDDVAREAVREQLDVAALAALGYSASEPN